MVSTGAFGVINNLLPDLALHVHPWFSSTMATNFCIMLGCCFPYTLCWAETTNYKANQVLYTAVDKLTNVLDYLMGSVSNWNFYFMQNVVHIMSAHWEVVKVSGTCPNALIGRWTPNT